MSNYFSIKLSFHLIILSIFIVFCQNTPFSPIEAGTFYISAADLKGVQKKSIRQIQLQTPWSVFNQNLNINVACVIASISIDERVGMEFTYKLADKLSGENGSIKKKIILVQITDKKKFSYPPFQLGINYIVAQNLRTDNYNMTDFQQHLTDQSITPQEGNPSNKEVHNQLFLFPNGFSSFNLTHNVMYSYVAPPYDMYTIHYMTGMGEHMEQGWKSGKDFINFRWILSPKYQFGYDSCPTVYETQLVDDFYYTCDKNGVDGYFFGLMGYSGANFVGKFDFTRNGFSFKIDKKNNDTKYNVLAIPYKLSQKFNFIDNRLHRYDYVEQKSFFGYLIAAVILLIVIIVIVIVVIKRKKLVYFDLQEQKVLQTTSSSTNYDNIVKQKSNKSPNKNRALNAPNRSGDQQLKEQPFNHSQVYKTQQIQSKPDDFTIE